MGKNPKVSAVLCALAGAYLIYDMATARESPSTALWVLQLVLIAGCIAGLVGAVMAMNKSQSSEGEGGKL